MRFKAISAGRLERHCLRPPAQTSAQGRGLRSGRRVFTGEFDTRRWRRRLTAHTDAPQRSAPMNAASPHWSEAILREERDRAERLFVSQRKDEGPAAYYAVCNEVEPLVRNA